MGLVLYNTATRSKEPFEALEPPKVRLYTCGPTVYNYAHIGNLRAFLAYDLVRRVLELRGYDVQHVMNITDVDDKTIRDSQAANRSLKEHTDFYLEAFLEDMRSMNILLAHERPRATEAVPAMLAMIDDLLASEHAYRADDGSVYFSVKSQPGYGALAQLDLEQLQVGERVAADEYEKDDVRDFALWKAWSEKDGPVKWPSPHGEGRPGWHLECSVLAIAALGPELDIHMGGVDLIFPHHVNEIAQSEAATGKRFARFWLHNEHLLVDGRKMSKSLGNFYTLRDLVAKGISGRALRYNYLGTHYRQKQNLTLAGLKGASSALSTLDDFVAGLDAAGEGAPRDAVLAEIAAATAALDAAFDDDINTPKALGVLFATVRSLKKVALRGSEVAAVQAFLDHADAVLGILDADPDVPQEAPPDVRALADQRVAARASRNWALADQLRDQISAAGWTVEDGKGGYRLVPAKS